MSDATTFPELFGAVFPAESETQAGVVYGPRGDDLTGTLQGGAALVIDRTLVLVQGDSYDGVANPKPQWATEVDYTDGWEVMLTIRDQDDHVIYDAVGEVVDSETVRVAIDPIEGLTMRGCPGVFQGKYDVELRRGDSVKTLVIGTVYINEDQTR